MLGISLSHIPREQNALVDNLAKWGVGLSSLYISSVLPDSCLYALLSVVLIICLLFFNKFTVTYPKERERERERGRQWKSYYAYSHSPGCSKVQNVRINENVGHLKK